MSLFPASFPWSAQCGTGAKALVGNGAMCYKCYMDTTIRNLDAHAYRALRAQAAKEGRPVGVLISEAIRSYLAPNRKFKSIFDFPSEDFGPGTEHLSEQVDQIVYGVDR